MSANPSHPTASEQRIADLVLDALRGLRFGSIHLTIHEGRLVQIERIERTRLSAPVAGSRSHEGQPESSSDEASTSSAPSAQISRSVSVAELSANGRTPSGAKAGEALTQH